MKNLKNFVILKGHLGKDPEYKELKNGSKMVKLRVATNESYKNAQGDWIDRTAWHSCISWDNIAEKAQKALKKGVEVIIKGKLSYRQYEDKEGIKRQYTNIVIEDFMAVPKQRA